MSKYENIKVILCAPVAVAVMLASAPSAGAQNAQSVLQDYCAATRGQSCYDEGIIGPDGQIGVAIPRYDVDAQCRRSGLDVKLCIEAEQSDYEAAKQAWPHLSEKSQRECATSFRTEGSRRYASFMGCVYARAIEERYAAERRRPPPNFRY